MDVFFFVVTLISLFAIILVSKTFIVVPEREAVIKERLGRYTGTLKPGLHFFIPFIDNPAYRQEIREQAINVPPQGCITRDNIQVDVDGVVYLKVFDGQKASYGINDYVLASINLAQTTMRSEIGKLTLDESFSERERINENIVREIDKASSPWGVKMIRYEIMNITPSRRVIETMEKQMEAERDKRAEITRSSGDKQSKINRSEGVRQASINLSEGEKQRRINEANGRAEEIKILAEASSQGIALIAEALQRPGGTTALKMQLVEQFIDEFGKILRTADVSVVPAQLATLKGFFEGMSQLTESPNAMKPVANSNRKGS